MKLCILSRSLAPNFFSSLLQTLWTVFPFQICVVFYSLLWHTVSIVSTPAKPVTATHTEIGLSISPIATLAFRRVSNPHVFLHITPGMPIWYWVLESPFEVRLVLQVQLEGARYGPCCRTIVAAVSTHFSLTSVACSQCTVSSQGARCTLCDR